jgi:hypothetical protein
MPTDGADTYFFDDEPEYDGRIYRIIKTERMPRAMSQRKITAREREEIID